MAFIKLISNRTARGLALLGLLILALAVSATRPTFAQPQDSQDQTDGVAPPQQDSAVDPSQISPSADPSSRVARLSIAQGNVSVEPASVNQFSPAELNDPLTTGDRLWADVGSVAELEAGQMAVRLGESTDLTVSAITDTLAQFGLAQGAVHLRTYALDPGTTTELDTPNVAVTVLQPGDVRVDVDPNGDSTTVSLISGEVEVDGNDFQQTLEPGQRVRLSGSDPVAAQWLGPEASDGLDNFSSDRDQAYESAEDSEQQYLNPDTIGGADLAQYGDWSSDDTYGDVWYPNVAAGWQPYCYGHWTWVAPWGWTWIESEPWGFAPFHYGRWVFFAGRWGWIPGPPIVHPVYSPALVVFVGAGNGLTAWFPLGPGEPYAPWYHASTLYLNRVNVSNLYNRNAAQVRAAYNTSSRQIYADPLGAQQHFANRAGATVAVSQASFAAGRRIDSSATRLSAAQLAAAPVLPHPMVTPERSMVTPAAAHALPPRMARPVLTSHENTTQRAAPPASSHPQPSSMPATSSAPIERRTYTPPAGSAAIQPRGAEQLPANSATQPRGTEPLPQSNAAQPEGAERLPENNATPQRQQHLYNRAVPPPSRPSFEEQRQAIQNTDPGRPLGPQQLQNLRESRPAGPPEVREAAPHPAPESRSAPPPSRSSPPPSRPDNRR